MRGTRSTVLTLVAVTLLFGFSSSASAQQGIYEEIYFDNLYVWPGIAILDTDAWSFPVPIWVEKDEVLYLHMWGDFCTNPATGKKEVTSPAASIFYWTPGMTSADFIKDRRDGLGFNYKLLVTGDASKNIVEEAGAVFKATKPGVVIISLADLSYFGGSQTLRIERFTPVEFKMEQLVWP